MLPHPADFHATNVRRPFVLTPPMRFMLKVAVGVVIAMLALALAATALV